MSYMTSHVNKMSSPGLDVFTEIISMFEDHYPETLKKTLIINGE